MKLKLIKHKTIIGHTHYISNIILTPDGQYVLTAARDCAVRIWQLSTSKLIRELRGHIHWISGIAITPNGEYIVSSSWDRTIKVWRFSDGELMRTFEEPTEIPTKVIISPDGEHIITLNLVYPSIRIWKISDGTLVRNIIVHNDAITALALSSDGQYIISGSNDNTVAITRFSTGEIIQILNGHSNTVIDVNISSDGETITSCCKNGIINQWRMSDWSLKRKRILCIGEFNILCQICMFPNKYCMMGIYTSGFSYYSFIYNILDDSYTILPRMQSEISSIAISSNEKFLVVAVNTNIIHSRKIINVKREQILKWALCTPRLHSHLSV